MDFSSNNLYATWAKYAAVMGLVASLGASISFNPESKLIAREDYNKNVHQMALAQKDTPMDAANKAADPNMSSSQGAGNLELKNGETKKDIHTNYVIETSLSPDGKAYTVTCVPTCKTCGDLSDKAVVVSGNTNGWKNQQDLEKLALASNNTKYQACISNSVKVASTTGTDAKPKATMDSDSDRFDVGEFSIQSLTDSASGLDHAPACAGHTDQMIADLADKASTADDNDNEVGARTQSADEPSSSDARAFKRFASCFIKVKIMECEAMGQTDDEKDHDRPHTHLTAADRHRCGAIADRAYFQNVEPVITQALRSSNRSLRDVAREMALSMLSLPGKYVTIKMADDLNNKTRMYTLGNISIGLAADIQKAQTKDLQDCMRYQTRLLTVTPVGIVPLSPTLQSQVNDTCNKGLKEELKTIGQTYTDTLTNFASQVENNPGDIGALNQALTNINGGDTAYVNSFTNRFQLPTDTATSMLTSAMSSANPGAALQSGDLKSTLANLANTGTTDGKIVPTYDNAGNQVVPQGAITPKVVTTLPDAVVNRHGVVVGGVPAAPVPSGGANSSVKQK
jgi:hypothetical protein